MSLSPPLINTTTTGTDGEANISATVKFRSKTDEGGMFYVESGAPKEK